MGSPISSSLTPPKALDFVLTPDLTNGVNQAISHFKEMTEKEELVNP